MILFTHIRFVTLIFLCNLVLVLGCQSNTRIQPRISVVKPVPAALEKPTIIIPKSQRNQPMEGSATRVYSVQPASKLLEKDVKLQEMGIVPPLPGLDNFLKDVPLNQKTTPNKMPELSVKSPFILPSAGDEIIRIGLLLPLTGFNRELAKDMLNAVKLALFSFADDTLELLVHDTHGTEEGSLKAASIAIADGAEIIIGPLLSSSVRAITPLVQAHGIPVIAFSSDETIVSKGIFTMGFSPRSQVAQVVKFAVSKGAKKFAVLAPKNQYGETVSSQLMSASKLLEVKVTDVELYEPDTEDFSPIVREIANYDKRRALLLEERKLLSQGDDELSKKALERLEKFHTMGDPPFDALLLADGGKRLQEIAALLPFYDVDPAVIRILGTGQWDVEGIGAEPALIGGFFAAPDPAFRKSFESEFFELFETKPARLATLAYDATALVAVLAQLQGKTKFSENAITDKNGYLGRDGIFRFLTTGHVQRGLAILRVKRHNNAVVVPAPESFNVLIN